MRQRKFRRAQLHWSAMTAAAPAAYNPPSQTRFSFGIEERRLGCTVSAHEADLPSLALRDAARAFAAKEARARGLIDLAASNSSPRMAAGVRLKKGKQK
jgi:hypothetical protein